MPSNPAFRRADELPNTLPVFPLPGALLLPRGEMPLNIFEPRYLVMIDDALKGDRLVGMIQPVGEGCDPPPLFKVGCAGRLTAFSETGDGRYLITLTGLARYQVLEELQVTTPYRQCRVDFRPFGTDLLPHCGEETVDRPKLLKTLKAYLSANNLAADWESIDRASNETLVNALSMMSPFGTGEKQALLEAPDLKSRAEILVALTEIELARSQTEGETKLQ
jgi:uncharacterized protein